MLLAVPKLETGNGKMSTPWAATPGRKASLSYLSQQVRLEVPSCKRTIGTWGVCERVSDGHAEVRQKP